MRFFIAEISLRTLKDRKGRHAELQGDPSRSHVTSIEGEFLVFLPEDGAHIANTHGLIPPRFTRQRR